MRFTNYIVAALLAISWSVMPSSASPKSIFYYESMLSDILKNSPSFIDFTRGFPMYMGSVKHGRAAAESIVKEIK